MLQQIYHRSLKSYLERIESQLESVANEQEDTIVQEMVSYALGSGRRFRPLLFLLTYRLLDTHPDEAAFGLATAIEILHKASLLHDDLVDSDNYRRGRPAFHTRYGMAKTIIAADLLVAEANLRFNKYADTELARMWHKQHRSLCYGELLDVISLDVQANREQVARIIYGKTAGFLEFVLRAGCYAAGGTEEQQELLASFGREVGFIFQIINDYNNWSGLEEQLGRKAGGDLEQGKANYLSLLGANAPSAGGIPELLDREIRRHQAQAAQALDRLGISNEVAFALHSLLDEKYDTWYWLDEDGACSG